MEMDKPSKSLQAVLDKQAIQDQLRERMLLIQKLDLQPARTATMLQMLKVPKDNAHLQQVQRTQQELKARRARAQLANAKTQYAAFLSKVKDGK